MNKQQTRNKMIKITSILLLILITTPFILAQNELTANIQVTIPENYQKMNAGEDLLANIKILNLANMGRIDVILDFKITSDNDNIIYTKKETVAIETQANFVRIFKIPENTKTGKYTLQTTMIFADGKELISETNFDVTNTKNNLQKLYMIIIILIIISILIFIGLKTKKHIKTIKLKMKINKIIKNKTKINNKTTTKLN